MKTKSRYGLALCLSIAAARSSVTEARPPSDALKEVALSKQEVADIKYVHGHLEDGVPHLLNLADERQHRYVTSHLKRHGINRENSPSLFSAFDALKANRTAAAPKADPSFTAAGAGELTSLNLIANLDETSRAGSQISYKTAALSSVPGGTNRTSILLELISLENGRTFQAAAGSTPKNQWVQGENFLYSLSGSIPSSYSNKEVKAQAVITVIPKDQNLDTYGAQKGVGPHVYTVTVEDSTDATSFCQNSPNYLSTSSRWSNACVND